MTKTDRYKKNQLALTVSALVAASAGMSVSIDAIAEEQVIEEIVVVGIQGSLQRSQAVKLGSSSVVEAISAEDIGKLPDSSIAESLARLPGLAGERRAGRTSGLSVRGFREDFVGTTLNGRELIGIGDNRGVEYDLYPSEIMSGAVVYKAPDAAMSVTGIGGTVDLKTARPLDVPSTLTFNGSYEQNDLKSANPDFDDTGHRLAVSYSDVYLDGKVGLALAYASTESPSQTEFNMVSDWVTDEITSGPYAGFYVPGFIDTSFRSRVLERDTFSGVLQFAPGENFTATLDYLHIDFADTGISRGFIEDLPNYSEKTGEDENGNDILLRDGRNVISAANGVVTSATTTGFRSVIRSDPLEKTGELTSYGLNLDYSVGERWRVKLDMAHSDSNKDDLRGESYAGVGRAGLESQGEPTTRTWELTGSGLLFSNNTTDFSDYDTIRLAGPQSWGGSLASITELDQEAAAAGLDPEVVGFAQAQDGFLNTAIFEEELDSYRLEATFELGGSFFTSINFGMRYSDHFKSKVNSGAFLTAETYPLDGPVPEGVRRGITDLGFAGLDKVVAYDALAVIKSDFYRQWDATSLEPDRLGDTYRVSEKIWQPFVKVDFDAFLRDVSVFGNVGLQVVHTEQNSKGFSDARQGADFLVVAEPFEDGASYNNVLPSLNLNIDLGEGHMVRFAAARAISRARIDELGPGSYVKFDNNIDDVLGTTPEGGPWSSASGNARLRPYEANQFDLAYEWYFSELGYLSLTYFYKDLVNWIRESSEDRDFTEFYIEDFHVGTQEDGTKVPPGTLIGVNRFLEDGIGGDVDGIEFQFNLPFGEFVERLDGLGLLFGCAFTDGELEDGSRIRGLSEEVYQATLFYEHSGFEIRLSATKRDDFLSEDRGGSNSLTEVVRSGIPLLDAQISYDFFESDIRYLDGLRISLQAQNLTDEDETSTDDVSGLITRNERYGRNLLLSFNYSFF